MVTVSKGHTSAAPHCRCSHKSISTEVRFFVPRYLVKPELSAIQSPFTSNDHHLKTANVSVIDKCNRFDIRVLESLYIHKTKSHLNN